MIMELEPEAVEIIPADIWNISSNFSVFYIGFIVLKRLHFMRYLYFN